MHAGFIAFLFSSALGPTSGLPEGLDVQTLRLMQGAVRVRLLTLRRNSQAARAAHAWHVAEGHWGDAALALGDWKRARAQVDAKLRSYWLFERAIQRELLAQARKRPPRL